MGVLANVPNSSCFEHLRFSYVYGFALFPFSWLSSIIGFTEFFAAHRYITGVNPMYFPSAAIEMLGYLCMTLAASALLRLAERRMDGESSYELVQADALTMTAGTYSRRTRPQDEGGALT